jgi:hypothetical protein
MKSLYNGKSEFIIRGVTAYIIESIKGSQKEEVK